MTAKKFKKIMLLGEPDVGKTTLLSNLSGKTNLTTIPISNLEVEGVSNEKVYGGPITFFSPLYSEMSKWRGKPPVLFYRNTSILIFIFKKNATNTISNLSKWVDNATEYAEELNLDYNIILLANKVTVIDSPNLESNYIEQLKLIQDYIANKLKPITALLELDILNGDLGELQSVIKDIN